MVEIRRAAGADAEAVLAYCRCVGGESDNLTFGSEGVAITLERERDYLESIRQSDRQLYLLAVEDGEIIGSGIFESYAKPRLSHRGVISMSVRKDRWGQGVGSNLMAALLDFARETARVEVVSLEVRSDNARAIALYRKFGFETVGAFEGYMKIGGQYVSCDTMRLQLQRGNA